MRRRTWIRLTLSTAAWLPFRGLRLRAWTMRRQIAPATLRAVADVVLPAALGPSGVQAVVDGFTRWTRGYRPQAEMTHGYGITRLRTTGTSPEPGYVRQLEDLEQAAARTGGSLPELPLDARRSLVIEALTRARITELPRRPDGRHVVADLMSYYFQGSEANDVCHGAAIGRRTCRGLPGAESAPRPL